MEKEKVQHIIEETIENYPKSRIYSNASFSFLENNDAVRKSLSRLNKSGKLMRVTRGFYKPVDYNNFLKENVSVDPDEVAKAYAEDYGWTIAPYGTTALNILGLSTQVPNVFQYISDGPYKKVKLVDGRIIEFKHKTIREISKLSYQTSTFLEALKAFGKENINNEVRNQIRHKISKRDLEIIKNEASKSRDWVFEEICKLLGKNNV